ncbi:lipid II:glycine glycyltransferase FemX [Lacticaseibacillus suihuaensis]
MPIVNLNDQAELDRYEAFVENAPYTSVTQSVNWGKVKNNWTPLYVYLEDGGAITAAMSILMTKDPNGDTFAYCSKGPVADPTDVALIQKLVAEAKPALIEHNVFLLRMDPEVLYSDELNKEFEQAGFVLRNRQFTGDHDTIQPRYNIVLDVAGKDIDGVMATMTGKTRTKIRHGIKAGVTVESGDSIDLVPDFFDCYKIMSEIHGITYRPQAYFERIAEAFGGTGHLKIFIAKYDGEVQASALALTFGDQTWHVFGGSKRIQNSLMVPYVLQYDMIKWATEQGVARYDMGGVWAEDNSDGLYRFKHPFAPDRGVLEYLGEIDYVLNQEAYDKFTK